MKQLAQSAGAVLMIRPRGFHPNPETAADNAFQRQIAPDEKSAIGLAAEQEFDRAVATLRSAGATVHVLDDTPSPEKPDAVFPNNWFSAHHDGRVVFYPMHSPTRRRERRPDVVDELRKHYRVSEVLDYSSGEARGRFLEGTGSLVLDYANRVAYASLSQRTDPDLVDRFCAGFWFHSRQIPERDCGWPRGLSHERSHVHRDRFRLGWAPLDSRHDRARTGPLRARGEWPGSARAERGTNLRVCR